MLNICSDDLDVIAMTGEHPPSESRGGKKHIQAQAHDSLSIAGDEEPQSYRPQRRVYQQPQQQQEEYQSRPSTAPAPRDMSGHQLYKKQQFW